VDPETRTLERGAIFRAIDQPSARSCSTPRAALPDPSSGGACSTPSSSARSTWALRRRASRAATCSRPIVAQAAFDAAVAADPELAKVPRPRLEWFYKRHPSWDERINLTAIYRGMLPAS